MASLYSFFKHKSVLPIIFSAIREIFHFKVKDQYFSAKPGEISNLNHNLFFISLFKFHIIFF